ncbi:MAG: hypothetical protein Q7U51_06755 [Methanoregula sp.]|nr:hypothetical protein [Methanoregula sp.]
MNATPPTLQYSMESSVAMPNPESEQRFGIRVVDWKRIRRDAVQFTEPPSTMSRISDACFSVSVTAIFTFIGLLGQQNLSSWILPTIVVAAILFFLFGALLLYFHNKEIEGKKRNVKIFQNDMDEIEKMFAIC